MDEEQAPAPPVRISAYRDGPLIVRGAVTVTGADGRPVPVRRRVVALCRCGGSGIAPFCDGTHRLRGFRDPGDQAAAASASPPD